MSSLAAGLAIGIVGDAGVRANAQQPRLFAPWHETGVKLSEAWEVVTASSET